MKPSPKRHLILTACLALLLGTALEAQAIDGATLLAKVDQYRVFQETGFSFQYTVSDSADQPAVDSVMRVYLKKTDRTSVVCAYLSPLEQAGRRILVQNNSFWLLDKAMRDPIRISARQMMFGQASTGDITRIVFTGAYRVDSAIPEGDTVTLKLSALKNADVTYPSIRLVVQAADARPLRADLIAATGTLLRTIEYQEFREIGDRTLLTRFTITNALNHETSRISLDKFSDQTLADRFFTQGGLKVLQ